MMCIWGCLIMKSCMAFVLFGSSSMIKRPGHRIRTECLTPFRCFRGNRRMSANWVYGKRPLNWVGYSCWLAMSHDFGHSIRSDARSVSLDMSGNESHRGSQDVSLDRRNSRSHFPNSLNNQFEFETSASVSVKPSRKCSINHTNYVLLKIFLKQKNNPILFW